MGEQPSTRREQCNEQQWTLHGGILRQARDNPGAIAVVEVEVGKMKNEPKFVIDQLAHRSYNRLYTAELLV